MYTTIDYLETGNDRQRAIFDVLNKLGIMKDLAYYNPVLCGTFPIEIDVQGSDLDIIFEVYDVKSFEKRVKLLYGEFSGFQIKHKQIRERAVVKVNFLMGGYEFELFGQAQPVFEQYAYLHMIIESKLLNKWPHIKEEIIALKRQGIKTEQAFCQVLGIHDVDPYESLIQYGKKQGFICE
ncbi:DUF4269 domain-containing protein [Alkalihalobacillus pseudalcaliphilus]|uniref:DUF4269 domain-containing protein n=1 Tax=Alkalihalobacillus pseudalcaliphilus TaxID=79884 RepID=UPI00064DC4E2|nr:DUF4269 domain-containing protein [Alkalihalobacillus pseudalcaliphilus]KMK76616.1 alpha/beta hydrolase [Alkalihalobacillus pseudalcaliphilus]